MSFTRVPGFLPSQNGFHFSNGYGAGTTYPVVTLPVVGTIVSGDAGNGLCGGFVLAALDLFCHSPRLRPPPDTSRPPAGSPIFNYLVARLLDSFTSPTANLITGNAARVVEWIHTPGHDVIISFFGAGLARRVIEQEWPKIKHDIDAGVPSPLNLVGGPERGVADVAGIIASLHHCHQVLAYGYEVDSAKNLTLLVYDCNDPMNDNSRISLNIGGDPGHTVAIAAPAINANMSGGIDVRGFFRTSYALRDPSVLTGSAWQEIGHANSVVTMTALHGKLFCVTSDNRLWARDPVLTNVNWQEIGHANNVVAMSALGNQLFCVTRDNKLWVRDPVLANVNWREIGHANDVVAMTALGSKLFCATRDNQLWARDPILSNVSWQAIGHANDVLTMAALGQKLFCVTKDGKLWARDPVLANVNWHEIGTASNIAAIAAINGKLFGATRDNKLLVRDAAA
jgi:hypothetical protein